MTLITRYLAEVYESKLVIPLIHLPSLRCDRVDVRQYVTHYLNRGRILGVENRIDRRLYARPHNPLVHAVMITVLDIARSGSTSWHHALPMQGIVRIFP
jgi:hypothetical protein